MSRRLDHQVIHPIHRVLLAPVAVLAAAALATGCSSSKSHGNPSTGANIGGATSTNAQAGSNGDQVEVKNFDRRFKKVTFSVRVLVEGETREAYNEYLKKEQQGSARMTLGDALKGKLKK